MKILGWEFSDDTGYMFARLACTCGRKYVLAMLEDNEMRCVSLVACECGEVWEVVSQLGIECKRLQRAGSIDDLVESVSEETQWVAPSAAITPGFGQSPICYM